MENTITFNNYYGTLPLEETVRSIFDQNLAGQIAMDGNYYCIHADHKTHKLYAVSQENETKAGAMGRPLEFGEIAEFNDERVRCMTMEEEQQCNEDRLMACVDLWGNIAVDEKFDTEWYLEHCI